VELKLGFRYVRSFGIFDLGAKLAGSYRYNRDFIGNEANFHLGVELALWPGNSERSTLPASWAQCPSRVGPRRIGTRAACRYRLGSATVQ
jgi:hypothetical protein